MKKMLNTYIRMLIESIEDDIDMTDSVINMNEPVNNDLTGLQDRYSDIIAAKDLEYSKQPTWKDIEKLKKKNITKSPWTSGWNDLKKTTDLLNSAINNNLKQYGNDKTQLIQICMNAVKNLDYKKLGEGATRTVFSKKNCDFVIKVARNIKGLQSNFFEVNNYINHANLNTNIYPKLLSYDQSRFDINAPNEKKDVLWIIMEKVSPIAKGNEATETITPLYHIEDIFPLFCTELNTVLDYMQDTLNDSTIIQLKDEIKNKPAFYWDIISTLMVELIKEFEEDKRIPDDGSRFELRYMKYRQSENILPIANALVSNADSIVDKQSFVNLFAQTCQQFNLFQVIPADLMYVYNTFSDVMYEDMHLMNLGIKEKALKTNPNEPWKALCLLDYAEDALSDWEKLTANRQNNLF